MESLLAMNTAVDMESFQQAMALHDAPSANVTYADRNGHIAFQTIGLIPDRGKGRGLVPQAGNLSGNQWNGVVELQQMPRLTDPSAAYIAAANARVHPGTPLVSADNARGYRMSRLHSVLASRSDLTLDDMQALQLDLHNSQAERLLPFMLPALSELKDEAHVTAFRTLQSWAQKPENTRDSAGALIGENWYPELARNLFGHALGDDVLTRLMQQNYLLNHALDRLIAEETHSVWWRAERSTVLRESFMRTIQQLSQFFGTSPETWRWDDAHSVSFVHELNGAAPFMDRWLSRGPIPWGGGNPTLGRARYSHDQPFKGRVGATVRVVAKMGEDMEVRAITPGGQHGHPSSRYYDDQLDSWLKGELDTLANSPEDVTGITTSLHPVH